MNDTFLSEVLRLSNDFRAENGLDPLVANDELDEAAQSHSEAMARRDFFNHTGLDGKQPWDRAEDAGYDYQAIAENIAAGQRTPEAVVRGWINSPSHRANLLNPTYTDLGVGYFNLKNDTGSVNYNTYWTQLFGSGDSVAVSAESPGNSVEDAYVEPVVTVPTITAEAEMTGAVANTAGSNSSRMTDTDMAAIELSRAASVGEMAHSMDGSMPHSAGHADLNKLIAKATPTHTAVRSGRWSDPSTWQRGRVPGNGATVMIGDGKTVIYNVESNARLDTVIVEGELRFARNRDTKLVVETILNADSGTLSIGSQRRSVAADKQAQIIFRSDRGINTRWDPTQLTKGLVSHGEVNIFGADKLDRVELAGNVAAGDNVLTFKELPTGWRVGDKIVLGGTEYNWNGSDKDNSRFQDEVLTITDIRGKRVRFKNDDIRSGKRNVLRFDHTGSRFVGQGATSLYAANITRNVSFETENGKAVPINRRAHVMLMHNPDVNVFNAGFYDLGRSDKTKLVDDLGENVDGSRGNGSNIRGRYALHLHEMGVENPNGTAALIKGNAVVGSPGWGIVQHQSHAGLESNVVFDVVGSGIVAENGNEIGWWTDNTVIKTTGIDARAAANQEDARERRFDLGFSGDGYWVQGAGMVASKDNVAISSNSAGMQLFGGTLKPENNNRPVTTIPISQLPRNLRSLFPAGQKEVDVRDIPMATVEGFEAYNGTTGLEIWGHKTNFDGEGAFSENRSNRNPQELPETAHTGRSLVKDFKLWGNRWAGAKVQYSSNIDFKNGLILGTNRDRTAGGAGLFSNHATFNSVYNNLKIAGFRQGADIEYPNTDKDFITTTLKNSRFFDNTYNLSAVGDEAPREGRPDDFGAFVRLDNNQFDVPRNNRAPVARFNTKAAGGLAVTLDAGASSDADPLLPGDGSPRTLASKGIASYGWDLNNDGTVDRFGRKFEHVFDRAGRRRVALTVTDAQGASTTVKKIIDVQPSRYGNAFADGDFGGGTLTQLPWKSSSRYSDQGWYVKEGSRIAGGVAQISSPGEWNGFVGQVTRNDKVHRGEQTLRFRMKNIEGTPNDWEKNEVTVTLWGVNGQFDNNAWLETGPTKIGALPMRRTRLVNKVYGGKDGPARDFFNWKNISVDVDLGKGYDYLMFQVNSSASRDPNDMVAIDNVSLTGAANAIPGKLVPTNTLNPTVTGNQRRLVASSVAPIPDGSSSIEEALVQIAQDTATVGRANDAELYGAEGIGAEEIGTEGIGAGNAGAATVLAKALNSIDDGTLLNGSGELNGDALVNQLTAARWPNTDDAIADKAQGVLNAGSREQGKLQSFLGDDLLSSGAQNWITRQLAAQDLDAQNIVDMLGQVDWEDVRLGARLKARYGPWGDSGIADAADESPVFKDVFKDALKGALSSQQVQQLALV